MVQKFSPDSHIIQVMEHSYRTKISSKENSEHNGFHYNNPFYAKATLDASGVSKGHEEEGEDDLFKSIREFLIVGKLIGLIPFSGVLSNSSKDLSFRRTSLSSIVSHVISSILIVNASLGVISSARASKKNALEIAQSVRATLYFIWGCFIYLKFIFRGEQFLEILHIWRSSPIVYSKQDKTLRRDVFFISAAILTSAILENGVLHLEYFKDLDSISGEKYNDSTYNMSRLEVFYWRSHPHWGVILGYNWFIAVLAFLQHKWILYAWNYMDILIAIFGRALYFKFKMLGKVAEERLLKSSESHFDTAHAFPQDRFTWVEVVQDHKKLCRVLDTLENFFSSLVFGSYAINMYYICMQLLDGLTSEVSQSSIIHSIYAPWSFLHLIMRIFIVSISCARINVYAHEIRNLFHDCPDENYTKEISRVDRRITSGPEIGLTGLGCFVVTKPFILSILGVVFTFEIVLLQCVPTAPTPSTGCCCPPIK